jgi:RNA polymerase sigma-70 factor (ECF subfamily)
MEQTGVGPGATRATDRGLVDRARRGDLAAFEAIAAEQLPALYRFARAILGDDTAAADAASSTVVAAWHELPHLDDPARFDAWVEHILVSECRMDVERAAPPTARSESGTPGATPGTPGAAYDTTPGATPGAADELDREAVIRLLDATFESLDAVDRAVVVLHDLDGRVPAAIGGSVHMPLGTVRWRLHEAHERFRSALETPG